MNDIRITLNRSSKGTYSGTRQCGPGKGEKLTKIDIGPQAKVTLEDGRAVDVCELLITLGSSANAFAKGAIVWNQRCQATVGEWLGEQIFGVTELSTKEREWFNGPFVRSHGIAVVIVSSDHHVASLPWPLLLLSSHLTGIHPKKCRFAPRPPCLISRWSYPDRLEY